MDSRRNVIQKMQLNIISNSGMDWHLFNENNRLGIVWWGLIRPIHYTYDEPITRDIVRELDER